MKRVSLAALTLIALVSFGSVAHAADFLVPEGTEITVAFDQDVSSKYVEPGDEIPIRLVEPIEIGGQVIVESGAKGSGRVKSVDPAGKPGSPGKVEVELLQLTPDGTFKSIDDKPIPIEGADGTIVAEGKGRKTLSWLFIFGLFIKGTEGEIEADQPIPAVVTEGVMIEVN
jgi:hypothetical protein